LVFGYQRVKLNTLKTSGIPAFYYYTYQTEMRALHSQHHIQRLLLLIGPGILLIITSACGGIIQIGPVNTPTPTAPVTQTKPSTDAEIEAVTNSPTRIAAQTIALDAPVVEMGWHVVESVGQQVSEWEMPNTEAGWHRNSAGPGEGSNVVISGHNASTGGQVFAGLDELQVGDEITVWADADSFVYQVVDKTIIRTFAASDEADAYLRTVTEPTDHEQLTLITCWPNWTNTHRLIVIAEPRG
jgi:LPXTG-site transpeptidase (sortase) family protein